MKANSKPNKKSLINNLLNRVDSNYIAVKKEMVPINKLTKSKVLKPTECLTFFVGLENESHYIANREILNQLDYFQIEELLSAINMETPDTQLFIHLPTNNFSILGLKKNIPKISKSKSKS